MKDGLLLLLKGIAIGVANIIPGVSGGTMAVVLGIYDRLVGAIGRFLTKPAERKGHFVFLVLVGIGAIGGIVGLSGVLKWSLERHESLTILFFMGLVLGSLPPVIRMSNLKRLGLLEMGALAIGVCAVLALGGDGAQGAAVEATPALLDAAQAGSSEAHAPYLTLAIGGAAAGAAMIVPGISGSLVLLLLGHYYTVIAAIDDMNLPVLAAVAVGAALGILVSAKVIEVLLRKAPALTHSLIIGLVGGSIITLNPGLPGSLSGALMGVGSLVLGTLLSFGLSHGGGKA